VAAESFIETLIRINAKPSKKLKIEAVTKPQKRSPKMKKKKVFLSMVFGFFLVLTFTTLHAKEFNLKLGLDLAPGTPDDLAARKIAEVSEKLSNGELKFKIFTVGQLGSAMDQIESVTTGNQDSMLMEISWFGNLLKDWNVLAMPFTFKDQKHLTVYLNSPLSDPVKKEALEKFNMRILETDFNRLPRVVLSKKPVFKPEDLSGLKFRVPAIPMYQRSWEAMGTKTTRITWGETYLGIKQGVADAMEGLFDGVVGMRFHEVAPYITMTNHSRTTAIFVINEKVWQSLGSDLQKALREAVKEGMQVFNAETQKLATVQEKRVMDEGGAIIYVGTKPFQDKIQYLVAEEEGKGTWSKGLYDKIQQLPY
jgi:TRAP-type transport system periplasmic protein